MLSVLFNFIIEIVTFNFWQNGSTELLQISNQLISLENDYRDFTNELDQIRDFEQINMQESINELFQAFDNVKDFKLIDSSEWDKVNAPAINYFDEKMEAIVKEFENVLISSFSILSDKTCLSFESLANDLESLILIEHTTDLYNFYRVMHAIPEFNNNLIIDQLNNAIPHLPEWEKIKGENFFAKVPLSSLVYSELTESSKQLYNKEIELVLTLLKNKIIKY